MINFINLEVKLKLIALTLRYLLFLLSVLYVKNQNVRQSVFDKCYAMGIVLDWITLRRFCEVLIQKNKIINFSCDF